MSDRPDWLDVPTRLRRSKRGNMVHAAGCRYATPEKSLPWLWAEDKTSTEIAAAARNGLTFCKLCRPVATTEED